MTASRSTRSRRQPERGSAMLVTLLIIGALLAGASVLVSLQLASSRSTDLTRSGTSALYCAEAGLTLARPIVLANYSQWKTALAQTAVNNYSEPAWIATSIDAVMGGHDLDGTLPATVDFTVYLEDNHDETTGPNDRAIDQDLQVFIVSTCNKYPDTPKQIRELVEYNGIPPCYPWQIGGCRGDNGVK